MEPRVGDSRSLFHRPVLLQNDPAMFQRVDEKQQLPSRILLARLRPLLRNNRSNPRIRLRHTRFLTLSSAWNKSSLHASWMLHNCSPIFGFMLCSF